MFVKNYSSLIKLAETKEETIILREILKMVNKTLTLAQPKTILSSTVRFQNNKIVIHKVPFDLSHYKRFFLITFGKASQTMAEWFLEHFPWSFSRIIIVSPEELNENLRKQSERILFFKSSHPNPNNISLEAAEQVLNLLRKLTSKDFCLFCISGGGSSLLESPNYGVNLDEYISLNESLLACGAPIEDINTVRKHLSKIKGGKLAIQTKATLLSLIMSDVLGDHPSLIASGPTAPDFSTWRDCEVILKKYNLLEEIPKKIISIITKGVRGELPDTPSEKQLFSHVTNIVVGSNKTLLQTLKNEISAKNKVLIVEDEIQGEARIVGKELAKKAYELYMLEKKHETSCFFLLFGGETTVTLQNKGGVGGRNQELALAFALTLEEAIPIYLASFGTDGIDGNSKAAGALIGTFTLKNREKREEAQQALERNDSNSFFKKYKSEIITGYTGTNLMDVGIIYIDFKSHS
ncbi:MAG: glycerate kinase type-2 family protein [Candidatus Heimdallarchaeaceae archaeon]